MNEYMVDFFRRSAAQGTPAFHQIHGAGRDFAQMEQALKGIDLPPELQLREYIYDMALLMRAADLVICRAGASTISELTALGTAAIIVPSPNVTNHHQERNAQVLADHGAALMLMEGEATAERMLQEAEAILADDARRRGMEENMTALGFRDANERIYQTVVGLVRN